jgi:hypothetical protein
MVDYRHAVDPGLTCHRQAILVKLGLSHGTRYDFGIRRPACGDIEVMMEGHLKLATAPRKPGDDGCQVVRVDGLWHVDLISPS